MHATAFAAILALAPMAAAGAPPAPLRPPAVPLVAHDPYFSIWSAADRLADADTTHWTGRPHRLTALVRIDGKVFRIMGREPADLPALPQTGVEVRPTRTVCTFEGEGIRLTLTFLTPALPDDLDVLARPVTYLVWEARSTDGRAHPVVLYADASPEIAVNEPGQDVSWSVESVEGLRVLRAGSTEQRVLKKKGDDLRIDWGHLYLAVPDDGDTSVRIGPAGQCLEPFLGAKPRQWPPLAAPLPPAKGAPVLSATLRMGVVGNRPVSRRLLLAYDDLYSIRYFDARLRPYWRRNGDDAAALLKKAAADFDTLARRCEDFDNRLMDSLRKAGGEKYAALCALAYRQTFAGNKICADAKGLPLMFPKENFSNGCIGTVDVLFPQAPFFLVLSPALAKAMLVPILDYASSPLWPYGYAPHDLGTYPWATGQVYGMRGGDGGRMPVEESGNMLIMMAALAKIEGDASLAERYWPLLTAWADYLVANGLDPENQLCSADMFGHLPRCANLALKAIIGIGGYAQLCDRLGKKEDAAKYMAVARDYAAKWLDLSKDDGRTRLAYNLPGTWGMKHNLIWDRVLGLGLFPDAVGDAEIAWYLKVQNKYGLPVDNRTDTSLIDWALWSIAPARDNRDFQALLDPIFRYAHETPDRVPLSDWFVTTDGRKKGFQARPVVGGLFIRLLSNPAPWSDWAGRAGKVPGPWAPLPLPRPVRMIVPTAQSNPVPWRYTLEPPAADWMKPGFDDSAWETGPAGFGTAGTPGAVVRTTWNTSNIWIRRTFTLDGPPPADPRLRTHYDEDARVYINGVLAAELPGWSADYEDVELTGEGRAALRRGTNLFAAHCKQTWGGQCIDVGLGAAEDAAPEAGGRIDQKRKAP